MARYTKQPFEELFVPVTETGCWLWIGKYASEHPRLGAYGTYKGTMAHRYAYVQYKGEIPHGHHVCHTCDVRECVNPDHLFLGTPAQNHQDMRQKGRHLIAPIKKCPTYEEVRANRVDYATRPPEEQPLWYKLTMKRLDEEHYQAWRKANWGTLRGKVYTPRHTMRNTANVNKNNRFGKQQKRGSEY